MSGQIDMHLAPPPPHIKKIQFFWQLFSMNLQNNFHKLHASGLGVIAKKKTVGKLEKHFSRPPLSRSLETILNIFQRPYLARN